MKKIGITILLSVLTLFQVSGDGYSRYNVFNRDTNNFLESLQNANRQVAQKALPVVVSIDVTSTIRMRNPRYTSPFEAFEFFFRDRGQPENNQKEEEPSYTERQQRGEGSGIIVEKRGDSYYVLTNNHVAGNADDILVTLYNGKEYQAQLVGSDSRKDIALVKFDTRDDVTVAQLADSDRVQAGDIVYAVGNPLGFESTFTSGIVSAVNRKGGPRGSRNFTDYIQTDAAINQGNSGGALVNIYGEVIGINTWIASQSGGSIGIGFAIPINNVKEAINSFIEDGKVEYGWLGISIGDPSEENAKELNIERINGSFVQNVYVGSPADKAGIQPGDFITSINNDDVRDSDQLVQIVADLKPGRSYNFELIRFGTRRTLKVRIAERDEEAKINQNETNLYPGLTVEAITDDIRDRLDLSRGSGDVIIAHVFENSPAGKAGIRPGDIIKEVNRERIRNVEDFFVNLNDTDRSEILFKINRAGQDLLIGIVPN